MGLDMYAFAVKTRNTKEVDVVFSQRCKKVEIRQWRRFNNLHGWMEQLYRAKGGTNQFNCATVRLKKKDIKKLWDDAPKLEPTPGFFFGQQRSIELEQLNNIQNFCMDAMRAIDEGYKVYYDSWW